MGNERLTETERRRKRFAWHIKKRGRCHVNVKWFTDPDVAERYHQWCMKLTQEFERGGRH